MYSSSKGGDRIFIESPDDDYIINALKETGELKFLIKGTTDSFTEYLFTVPTSNFYEIYTEATTVAE